MKYGPPSGSIAGVTTVTLGIVFIGGGRLVLGWLLLVAGIVLGVVAVVLRLRHDRRWLERAIAEDDEAARDAADEGTARDAADG